ncbi:hypothetical protein J1N35_006869 [Gossypium stocksii]|uniref:Uncharacterized protein n=1 Tax=Gossypium stocksii TaxID=47602 RepID=A0A9D4AF10_9ROSI|nr:hypothetical protein J1N35_006869 [Gossypium stocksii]
MAKEKATSELVELLKGLPPKEEVSLSSDLGEKMAMQTIKLEPMRFNSIKATELARSLVRLPPMEKLGSKRLTSVDTSEELTPMGEVGYASNFGKVVMQVGQLTRVNAMSKPSGVNQKDSIQNESKYGQERVVASCQRDVPTSGTVQVNRQCKARQKFQRKEKAKALRRDQSESSGKSVTGQSAKPMTIVPNVSHGGISFRWRSFGPQELTQFKELLKNPIRLKPRWPNDKDMAT